MNIRPSFAYALLGASAIYLFSKTDKGQTVVSEGIDAAQTIVSNIRGIRNNNPGNIALTGTKWVGQSASQTDGVFVQFDSMEYGARALARVLKNYQRAGYNTIRRMIVRYSATDQASYILAVSSSLGIDPDDEFDVIYDESRLRSLMRAIIRQECGYAGSILVSDSVISRGIELEKS